MPTELQQKPTEEQLRELLVLARAATPGRRWIPDLTTDDRFYGGPTTTVLIATDEYPKRTWLQLNPNFPCSTDVAFLAALDPEVVIALVQLARKARGLLSIADQLELLSEHEDPGYLLRKNRVLQESRDGLMGACEALANDWRERLDTIAMGIGYREAVRTQLAALRNLIAEHGGDEAAGSQSGGRRG